MAKRIAIVALLGASAYLKVVGVEREENGDLLIDLETEDETIDPFCVTLDDGQAAELGLIDDNGEPINLDDDHPDTEATPTDDQVAAGSHHAAGATPTEELPLTMSPEDSAAGAQAKGDVGDDSQDAFVVGDQTAAGALTPEEGLNPGGVTPAPSPETPVKDPLDPYNQNGQ